MNTKKKIVKLDSLKRIVSRLRREGKRIAFTNGCFDLLHFGHVSYLQAAKSNNRILIVGLNSDSSIRRIKGPRRPINKQQHRAAVLAALQCVDYVVIFNQDTPYKLIESLKPNILIKGADWKGKEVVGQDIVEEYGGKVELIRYVANFSTTTMISAIKRK